MASHDDIMLEVNATDKSGDEKTVHQDLNAELSAATDIQVCRSHSIEEQSCALSGNEGTVDCTHTAHLADQGNMTIFKAGGASPHLNSDTNGITHKHIEFKTTSTDMFIKKMMNDNDENEIEDGPYLYIVREDIKEDNLKPIPVVIGHAHSTWLHTSLQDSNWPGTGKRTAPFSLGNSWPLPAEEIQILTEVYAYDHAIKAIKKRNKSIGNNMTM
ncbi:hypothetical protein DACRYDRAFT_18787 [Dacryopinax primogenitus]|uniref:Uncharacterized protein n=1 Tax=Dacryopinax primogenitus (strain DJM 731) TaxID=1858805 RepID=M5FNG7_DACPD|nr:uncharacterized protein DACRYDRAFT_18787 [Dacryopinax primogenitus]EJT97415.1 hypothetical protein DACRYDRAFT_18787 [Dacryopinax primogenitus]